MFRQKNIKKILAIKTQALMLARQIQNSNLQWLMQKQK